MSNSNSFRTRSEHLLRKKKIKLLYRLVKVLSYISDVFLHFS